MDLNLVLLAVRHLFMEKPSEWMMPIIRLVKRQKDSVLRKCPFYTITPAEDCFLHLKYPLDVHSSNQIRPRISPSSVCKYFSLSNDRKVSESTALGYLTHQSPKTVNLIIFLQSTHSGGCLLPRVNGSESMKYQQAWKREHLCNTRDLGNSHTAQHTLHPTF